MNVFAKFAMFAGLAFATAVLPARATVQGQQEQQQKKSGDQQQAPAAQGQTGQQAPAPAPKLNPEEEKAYKSFFDLKPDNPQAIVSSGEDFLKKFPNSRYVGSVYAKLVSAYQATGSDQKMFDAGQKALQINPDNVDVLAVMAYSIPRRIDPNELGSDDKLTQAQGYAKHAIDLLGKMPKPANMTDEQFTVAKNSELASCHSGLGLVDYYQHNIPAMVSDLEQAVKLEASPDPSDQFLLGFAYAQTGRWTDSEAVLEKCSANPGPIQSRCKSVLDQVKKKAGSTPKQ